MNHTSPEEIYYNCIFGKAIIDKTDRVIRLISCSYLESTGTKNYSTPLIVADTFSFDSALYYIWNAKGAKGSNPNSQFRNGEIVPLGRPVIRGLLHKYYGKSKFKSSKSTKKVKESMTTMLENVRNAVKDVLSEERLLDYRVDVTVTSNTNPNDRLKVQIPVRALNADNARDKANGIAAKMGYIDVKIDDVVMVPNADLSKHNYGVGHSMTNPGTADPRANSMLGIDSVKNLR